MPRGTRAWPADLAGRGRSPYRIQESLCVPWRCAMAPIFLPAQIELDRMKSAGVIVTLWSPLRYQRCGIRRRICIPPPTGLDNNVIVRPSPPSLRSARSPLTTVVDSIPPHHFHPCRPWTFKIIRVSPSPRPSIHPAEQNALRACFGRPRGGNQKADGGGDRQTHRCITLSSLPLAFCMT